MKIAICSSAAFYETLFAVKEELEKAGHDVVIPISAHEMQEKGNFDVAAHKTWHDNPDDFHKKTAYIKDHIGKIDESDAILVINNEKNGIKGYIGGNVLLEIFYAWLHKKPIYILNPVTQELPLYEEVIGMEPTIINGDVSKIH